MFARNWLFAWSAASATARAPSAAPREHLLGDVGAVRDDARAGVVALDQRKVDEVEEALLRLGARCARDADGHLAAHVRRAGGEHVVEQVLESLIDDLRKRLQHGLADQLAVADEPVVRFVGEREHVLRAAHHRQKAGRLLEDVFEPGTLHLERTKQSLAFGGRGAGRRDVVEQHGDLPFVGPADAEGVGIVPATVRRHGRLDADRLSGARHAGVRLHPERIPRATELAEQPPRGIAQPRLPRERRVDLEVPDIRGLSLFIEQHLDDAQAGVDRLEQRAVARLALA